MSQIRGKRRGRRIKNAGLSDSARRKRDRYKAKVYRQVKDHLFRFLFEKNKDALLQLYNALNGTDYYCIEHGILKEFLRENRSEVIGMLLREFDVEKYERSLREEGQIRVSELFGRLLSQNRTEELTLAANDAAYQEKLLREMGI